MEKIFNIKLLLLLAIFTYFMFRFTIGDHKLPGGVPGSDVYITYISKTLRDEVGMTIHKSEFYLLDEILEDMLKDKGYPDSGEVRSWRGEGITNSEEMDAVTSEYVRRMDEGMRMPARWWRRSTGFSFSTGRWRILWRMRSSICTETWRGRSGVYQLLCDTREEAMASAKKALTGSSDPDSLMVEWLAKFFYTDEMSLLPQWVFTTTRINFPNLATIMLISVAILILPWQIRERLSGIRDLQGSSAAGRKLWDRQLLISLAAAAVVSRSDDGLYSGDGHLGYDLLLELSDLRYAWSLGAVPFTLGEYVLFSAGMMTLYVLACTVLFHLISRVAANYVVGFALILRPFCS